MYVCACFCACVCVCVCACVKVSSVILMELSRCVDRIVSFSVEMVFICKEVFFADRHVGVDMEVGFFVGIWVFLFALVYMLIEEIRGASVSTGGNVVVHSFSKVIGFSSV